MLISTYLFTAVALARGADAAYFFYPEWRCIEDHACAVTKRAESEDTAQDDISMKLVQRPSKVILL